MDALGFTETEFIAWITDGAPCPLPVGPGDDGAVLAEGTVVALDTIVESVHFDPGTDPDLVARKALGSCLSDLCAMGAIAESVFVSAQLPPGCDGRALAAGLRRWAGRFAVALGGGDTVASVPGALALAVTACGRCPPGRPPWLRSGARVGDALVVTGPLGGSRAGRHLRVVPRADVVAWAHRTGADVHAAIDLSDGLGTDLPRMCAASDVGVVLHADRLPIHADAAGRDDPLQAALGDGEDFELLLALPAGASLPTGARIIGEFTAAGMVLQREGGVAEPLPRGGYEHVF